MLKWDKWLIGTVVVILLAVLIIRKVNNRREQEEEAKFESVNNYEPNTYANSTYDPQPATPTEVNSTTFLNNYGTNIINGQTGHFVKASFSWTITKNEGSFNIKTNGVSGSFNVLYSHYDSQNKLYYYDATGSSVWDIGVVKLVMTSGTLGEYANGNLSGGNILTILFTDNNGYIYKLGR